MRSSATPSALLAAVCVALAAPAPATARLTHIAPTRDLGCRPQNAASVYTRFFQDPPDVLSCGTVVAVRGGGLYAPRALGDRAGRIAGRRLTRFRFVSRHGAVTTVRAGSLRVVETDRRFDAASETTTIAVSNPSARAHRLVIYRVGDCFPGSAGGYGFLARDTAACVPAVQDGAVARPVPGRQIIRWVAAPSPRPARYVGPYDRIYARMARARPLGGPCRCHDFGGDDIGGGLSWSLRLGPGETRTVVVRLAMAAGGERTPVRLAAATGPSLGVTATSQGRALAGAPVRFQVGEVVVARRRTDRHGRATAPWTGPGPRPAYVVAYDGDAFHRPARGRTGGPPAPLTPGRGRFPACAQVQAVQLDSLADPDTILDVATAAPSCSFVRYTFLTRRRGRLVAVGHLRGTGARSGGGGDLRLFTDRAFGSCVVEATDLRTGRVVSRNDQCIPLAGSQKAR